MTKHSPDDTGYECTAYFSGRDGLGACNTGCQWWLGGGCPKAKGAASWDGEDERTEAQRVAAASAPGEARHPETTARLTR